MSTNTQIQTADLNQIQAIGDFGVNELMALKESIAKKLTIPQFNLFMYQMNRMGLDPSLGHGVPILYGNDVNIRVEYEGYHWLAQKSPGYISVHRQVVCENETDDFEAVTDDNGVITKIHHKIKFPRGKVVGSYAIAKRDGRPDVIVLCDKSEFEKYAKKNPGFWKLEDGSLDPDMCKKHAATRAVKEQYDIAAAVEENMLTMNSAESLPEYKPQERKDITHEATHSAPTAAPETQQQQPEPEQTDEGRIKKARADMQLKFAKLGISDKEAKGQFLADNGKFKDPVKPTLSELTAVLRKMDLLIEQKNAAEVEELDIPLI